MGSVPHLYTTGDNDPEIYPVQYYRHYLYCDACGSFDLGPWSEPVDGETPVDQERLERTRRRLGMAALYSSPLALVSAGLILGFESALPFLSLALAGIALAMVAWGAYLQVLGKRGGFIAENRGFFTKTFLWLVIVIAVEWLADSATLLVPAWTLLLAGLLWTGGLLVWREAVSTKTETVGMRCRGCDATYRHGTPFFTDRDANPRSMTIDEVPRPLGISPFETGAYVGPAPSDAPSSLPR